MPVYNCERFLREAVESILSQTFCDFEFIIVNDGSTDSTSAILKNYTDMRVTLVDRKHQGLVASLNQGLALAWGEYVAIMHGDDVALPTRLERQVGFLCQHLEVGILGTACRLIHVDGWDIGLQSWPVSDLDIRWTSLLASPFGHPTVMMRRRVVVESGLNYSESFGAEDYDLWTRLLNYTRGANLREPLLKYRVHSESRTGKHRQIQLEEHDAIALRTIREQLPEFAISAEQVSQLRALFVGGREFTPVSDLQRVAMANLYLDMFENFISRHRGEPGLKALQRQETLRVARLVLRPPLQPGWMRIVGRLLTMAPSLPLLKVVGRRLGRHALNVLVRGWDGKAIT